MEKKRFPKNIHQITVNNIIGISWSRNMVTQSSGDRPAALITYFSSPLSLLPWSVRSTPSLNT